MFQPMEIRRKIPASTLDRVIGWLFFCAMFALPWVNIARVTTFLFIGIALVLFLAGKLAVDYSFYRRQLLFVAFNCYYLLQLVIFYRYPGGTNGMEVEQKISLIAIPLLLYVLFTNDESNRHRSIAGFVSGNIVAAVCCMTAAITNYWYTHDTSMFFYHSYAHAIGMNAIYFSLYLLVSLGYIVLDGAALDGNWRKVAGMFLYLNLLLLSSKMAVILGSLFLFILVFRSIEKRWQKLTLATGAVLIFILLAITVNPIEKRFAEIKVANYSQALKDNNFYNYDFDGLSLRLVLWRMGSELMNEKRTWLWGDRGKHYHDDLDEKMSQYRLYTGNSTLADRGYLDYNMHNQYMETYMQSGIIGLTILLFAIAYTLYRAISSKNAMLVYATVLFIVFFCTESVLETESGILLFTLILSGEWIQLQKKRSAIAI